MNMEIIQQAGMETVTDRRHEFKHVSEWGGGLSFDVDEHGEPTSDSANGLFNAPAGMMNYIRAILGPEWCPYGYEGEEGTDTSFEVINKGVVTTERQIRIYRRGLCDCGRKVYLDRFTNPCACGVDYDMSGRALAPRHLWGEETGEHWSECF